MSNNGEKKNTVKPDAMLSDIMQAIKDINSGLGQLGYIIYQMETVLFPEAVGKDREELEKKQKEKDE